MVFAALISVLYASPEPNAEAADKITYDISYYKGDAPLFVDEMEFEFYLNQYKNGRWRASIRADTYSSSNPKVLAVDSDGNYSAKKPGKATVVAKYKGKTYKKEYRVLPHSLTDSNSNTTVVLPQGRSIRMEIDGPGRRAIGDMKISKLKSSNSSIVKVLNRSNVISEIKAMKEGTASVTATVKGKKYKCIVKVVKPVNLKLKKASISNENGYYKFKLTVKNTGKSDVTILPNIYLDSDISDDTIYEYFFINHPYVWIKGNKSISLKSGETKQLTLYSENKVNQKHPWKIDWLLFGLDVDDGVGAYIFYLGHGKPQFEGRYNKRNTDNIKPPVSSENSGKTSGDATLQDAAGMVYTVTSKNKKEVQFSQLDKKASKVAIPASVTLNDTTYKVTSIAKNAFKNDKTIKKVTIGANIKKIGSGAFSGCKNLKTAKLGKKVAAIGKKAFYQCTGLTEIILPSNVKSIGEQAFSGCKSLKKITIQSTKLTSKNVGTMSFKDLPKDTKLVVPKSKAESYKKLFAKKTA